jgi:hypothetical protein
VDDRRPGCCTERRFLDEGIDLHAVVLKVGHHGLSLWFIILADGQSVSISTMLSPYASRSLHF